MSVLSYWAQVYLLATWTPYTYMLATGDLNRVHILATESALFHLPTAGAMSLQVDTATLLGLFASSILYGSFTVLLAACLYVLLYQRRTGQPNYLLVVTGVTMLLVNTAILALSFSRVMDAFIYFRDAPGGPSEYLGILSAWKEVARTSLLSVYIFVADTTMIYRCWIVWSRSYRIIAVPLVIHVACTVVGFTVAGNMAHLPVDANIFDPAVKIWIVAGFTLSLALTVIVTSLIIYKIWSVTTRASHGSFGALWSTVIIVVESGMLYVLTICIYLITYSCNSNSQYIMIDILNPMIGITFCLLVVRVAMRHSPKFKEMNHSRFATQDHISRSAVNCIGSNRLEEALDSTLELETIKIARPL